MKKSYNISIVYLFIDLFKGVAFTKKRFFSSSSSKAKQERQTLMFYFISFFFRLETSFGGTQAHCDAISVHSKVTHIVKFLVFFFIRQLFSVSLIRDPHKPPQNKKKTIIIKKKNQLCEKKEKKMMTSPKCGESWSSRFSIDCILFFFSLLQSTTII